VGQQTSSSESGCGDWRPGLGTETLLQAATGPNTAQLANRGVASCSLRGCFCEIILAFAIHGTAEKCCVGSSITRVYFSEGLKGNGDRVLPTP